jgi:rhamnosyltransferase
LIASIPLLDDLLVIIVLFRQSLLECASYQSLCKAVEQSEKFPALLVYDNSPEASSASSSSSSATIYIHNPHNAGVSKAYNEGSKVARQLNKKWILLADQDTQFPSTIFSDYSNASKNYPHVSIFSPSLFDSCGLVSPFRLLWGKGRRIRSLPSGIYSLEKYKIINSGMLISLSAFEKAGGFDERLPLDYSDICFAERISKVDPNFVLISSKCNHHFSASTLQDLTSEFERFNSFCKAARAYKNLSHHTVILMWIIIPRAIKLCFARKDLKFLRIGLLVVFRS